MTAPYELAMHACRLLTDACSRGGLPSGSFDWKDIAVAYQAARRAIRADHRRQRREASVSSPDKWPMKGRRGLGTEPALDTSGFGDRARLIYELRQQGLTFEEIGK